MASIPPPQGMSEIDYDAIEAAVTETVRGRWFLSEYSRRNRLAETRQLLDAMARIEAVVAANQTALPSADPSIRLLIQRIKEIAGQLTGVAGEMRSAGVETRLVEAVDTQARAVAGMMRGPSVASPQPTPGLDVAKPGAARLDPSRLDPPSRQTPAEATPPAPAQAMPRMPRAEPLATPRSPMPVEATMAQASPQPEGADPRLAALAELDSLSLTRKLALFT